MSEQPTKLPDPGTYLRWLAEESAQPLVEDDRRWAYDVRCTQIEPPYWVCQVVRVRIVPIFRWEVRLFWQRHTASGGTAEEALQAGRAWVNDWGRSQP